MCGRCSSCMNVYGLGICQDLGRYEEVDPLKSSCNLEGYTCLLTCPMEVVHLNPQYTFRLLHGKKSLSPPVCWWKSGCYVPDTMCLAAETLCLELPPLLHYRDGFSCPWVSTAVAQNEHAKPFLPIPVFRGDYDEILECAPKL